MPSDEDAIDRQLRIPLPVCCVQLEAGDGTDGLEVGPAVGAIEGAADGEADGLEVGPAVGATDGEAEGDALPLGLGACRSNELTMRCVRMYLPPMHSYSPLQDPGHCQAHLIIDRHSPE